VHLLPNYDEFLIAYRDRSASLDPRLEWATLPDGGILAHVVLLDGRVLGGWKRRAGTSQVVVELGPLGDLDAAASAALARAAGELERFAGVPVSVVPTPTDAGARSGSGPEAAPAGSPG
jgi:hypothetical protein